MNQLLAMIAFVSARFDLGRDDKDRGATATEYAMLIAFVAIIIGTAAALFGSDIAQWFGGMSTDVQNAGN